MPNQIPDKFPIYQSINSINLKICIYSIFKCYIHKPNTPANHRPYTVKLPLESITHSILFSVFGAEQWECVGGAWEDDV